MEITAVSWPRVKAKMDRAGISVAELARAAGEYRENVSAIIHGREYCSAGRQAKILQKLRELGVDA